eukprot:5507491-Pyramimonas_sp.AAC.1
MVFWLGFGLSGRNSHVDSRATLKSKELLFGTVGDSQTFVFQWDMYSPKLTQHIAGPSEEGVWREGWLQHRWR